MPKSLADLTLYLSRELSELEARCSKELSAAERARDEALVQITGAAKVLRDYHRGLEKAKAMQIRTTREADEGRRREVVVAEDKRRRALLKEERKYRDERKKAFVKRRGSERVAKAKWRTAVKKSKARPLSERRRLRRAADDAYEAALAESRETYNRAIETARLEHQAAIQDHLVDERIAVEAAHRKTERLITGAAIAYERAVAQEESKMRAALGTIPEARKSQETYDRQATKIRRACERDKEALFRKFTRERRGVRR